MNKSEIQELHQKKIEELEQLLQEVQKELAKARLEVEANRLEDTAKPYRLRKKLARIKTIIREKELIKEAQQKILAKEQEAQENQEDQIESNQ